MDKNTLNEKLMSLVVILTIVFVSLIVMMPVIVDKTTEKVIEELRSGRYTPGPYSPGFDPDVIDPNLLKKSESEKLQSSWDR